MKSTSVRLDRFVSQHFGVHQNVVKAWLAKGKIFVDHCQVTDCQQVINQFSHVVVDDQLLQSKTPYYMMLNKPAGCVSATEDSSHQTVLDFVGSDNEKELHIVGRLDFNSTGLVLLTNDGRWSRAINDPKNKIVKTYWVKLEKPLSTDYIDAFKKGMYFEFENIQTRPAELRILSDKVAEVDLFEGRYHQIKRMFGRFQNKVIDLHRTAVGSVCLDNNLNPGEYRSLDIEEVNALSRC